MPFFSPAQSEEVVRFAYFADKEARSDLINGFIRDENDYTSNFTGALRRNINSHSATGLRATSHMLPTTEERRYGCDATIVLSAGGSTKVALFEAKWPRLAVGHASWDYAQTASGLSHFSDQLDRQSRVRAEFVVFEMFYNDFPFGAQPHYMHAELSSCVLREHASIFDASRSTSKSPWTSTDLTKLLSTHPVLTVLDILMAMCRCAAGRPIRSLVDRIAFASEFALEGEILVIEALGS